MRNKARCTRPEAAVPGKALRSDGSPAMISAILPGGVSAVETTGGMDDPFLLPEEAAALGRASPKRLLEFTIGRTCARRALSRLGFPPAPIRTGSSRQPLWPPEVVGSITHCAGYCAAAVAHRRLLATIGIDAEAHAELPRDVLGLVALDEELRRLRPPTESGIHWDRVLFSAKESVYKAWFPLAGSWLGFKDAAVTLNPWDGTFQARLLLPGPRVDGRPVTGFHGRYRINEGRVITAAWLKARDPAAK